MAIASLLVSISRIFLSILRRSHPTIRGEASMHHIEKCITFSSYVRSPLPTWSISASFQCPGPAYGQRGAIISIIFRMLAPPQYAVPSVVAIISSDTLHISPIPFPHSHGLFVPHSQIDRTIGRPVLFKASHMVKYASRALAPLLWHQSYLRKSTPHSAYVTASIYS